MHNLPNQKILKYVWYYFIVLIPYILLNLFLAIRKSGRFSDRLFIPSHPISILIGIIGVVFYIVDIIIIFISIKRHLSKYLYLYPTFNVLFFVLLILFQVLTYKNLGYERYLNVLDYISEYSFILYIVQIFLVSITVWKLYINNLKDLIKKIKEALYLG